MARRSTPSPASLPPRHTLLLLLGAACVPVAESPVPLPEGAAWMVMVDRDTETVSRLVPAGAHAARLPDRGNVELHGFAAGVLEAALARCVSDGRCPPEARRPEDLRLRFAQPGEATLPAPTWTLRRRADTWQRVTVDAPTLTADPLVDACPGTEPGRIGLSVESTCSFIFCEAAIRRRGCQVELSLAACTNDGGQSAGWLDIAGVPHLPAPSGCRPADADEAPVGLADFVCEDSQLGECRVSVHDGRAEPPTWDHASVTLAAPQPPNLDEMIEDLGGVRTQFPVQGTLSPPASVGGSILVARNPWPFGPCPADARSDLLRVDPETLEASVTATVAGCVQRVSRDWATGGVAAGSTEGGVEVTLLDASGRVRRRRELSKTGWPSLAGGQVWIVYEALPLTDLEQVYLLIGPSAGSKVRVHVRLDAQLELIDQAVFRRTSIEEEIRFDEITMAVTDRRDGEDLIVAVETQDPRDAYWISPTADDPVLRQISLTRTMLPDRPLSNARRPRALGWGHDRLLVSLGYLEYVLAELSFDEPRGALRAVAPYEVEALPYSWHGFGPGRVIVVSRPASEGPGEAWVSVFELERFRFLPGAVQLPGEPGPASAATGVGEDVFVSFPWTGQLTRLRPR